jgi:hypothetical protein
MVTDPLAYTIQDACKATGLGRTKLYALISQGVNRRATGTRPETTAKSFKNKCDLPFRWGPDRRRSGPHFEQRFLFFARELSGM